MFRYNKSSNVSLFIQNLLRTHYTPTIPVLSIEKKKKLVDEVDDNDESLKNFNYIYGNHFYKGKEMLGEYRLGQKYPNVTDNYIPSESYYSTEVHEHLGDYLRAFRDFYKIDVMGMYNCFSNRLISSFSLPIKERERVNESDKEGYYYTSKFDTWYETSPANDFYKVTCFPIKFNTNYIVKIYGSKNGSVILQPALYNGNTFINLKGKLKEGDGDSSSTPVFTFKWKQEKNQSDFTFRYDVDDCCDYTDSSNSNNKNTYTIDKYRLLQNQRYLYMFMQVPQSNDLQISVIETSEYFNVMNKSLLDLDVEYNVPLSDKLLEYLVENVITPYDPIKQDITRVQMLLKSEDFRERFLNPTRIKDGEGKYYYPSSLLDRGTGNLLKLNQTPPPLLKSESESEKPLPIPPYNNIETTKEAYEYIDGQYDDTLRVFLYDLFANEGIKDFTGYIDKDVEELITSCIRSDKLRDKLREV